MLKSRLTLYVVVNEHFAPTFCISPERCVVKEISARQWRQRGYSIKYEGKVVPNTVFCGGRNGRDWDFLIKIAQAMPEVTFNCVMPKDKFEQHKENFGKNMVVKSDIPEMEFLEFMCQSQLVVTPLDTEVPAGGLIAFYQAAAKAATVVVIEASAAFGYARVSCFFVI